MGLFTRNTMSLPARAELFTWLYFCHADTLLKRSCWLEADDRTMFCNLWLERNGHRASFVWLSRICAEAEKFARFLVTGPENRDYLKAVVAVLSRYYKGEPVSADDQKGVQSLHDNAMGALLAARLN